MPCFNNAMQLHSWELVCADICMGTHRSPIYGQTIDHRIKLCSSAVKLTKIPASFVSQLVIKSNIRFPLFQCVQGSDVFRP